MLDGGFGSNSIVGASGLNAGRDTFLLNDGAGSTCDTKQNFHPGASVTLWD